MFAVYSTSSSEVKAFLFNKPVITPADELTAQLSTAEIEALRNDLVMKKLMVPSADLEEYILSLNDSSYQAFLDAAPIDNSKKITSGWKLFRHKIPMWIFITVCLIMLILSMLYQLSLIPVLGVLTCLYMMAQIELRNWIGFTIWLLAGLVIYFAYSYRNSKLKINSSASSGTALLDRP
jgi:hypothetical protein